MPRVGDCRSNDWDNESNLQHVTVQVLGTNGSIPCETLTLQLQFIHVRRKNLLFSSCCGWRVSSPPRVEYWGQIVAIKATRNLPYLVIDRNVVLSHHTKSEVCTLVTHITYELDSVWEEPIFRFSCTVRDICCWYTSGYPKEMIRMIGVLSVQKLAETIQLRHLWMQHFASNTCIRLPSSISALPPKPTWTVRSSIDSRIQGLGSARRSENKVKHDP